MPDEQDRARQKWTLTQEAFDKLLVALGGDRDSAAQKYLEIRTNLMRFFEWRGCSFPEDHADETINRIAKRVAEGEEILNYSGYALGVARLLLLEINKGRQREQLALAEIGTASEVYEEADNDESRLTCLRCCLQTLSTGNRELILQKFAVELRTLAGRQVWTRENLNARDRRGARAVGLTLPATVLKSGEYELRLRGVNDNGSAEDIGFYYFNVKKR